MSEQREFIRAQLSSGVDYYKGEKGDKPVKGVDYFTQEDIEGIVELIEAGDIDFSSYASKDYVDDAIAAIEIPPAYTLPTASTSTLGGVKVDGITITISDGVISSVGGGGSDIVFNTTYDAVTNKAATMADVDDAVTYIELPASVITTGITEQMEPVYLNQTLNEMQSDISGKQDSLTIGGSGNSYNASTNPVATLDDIDDKIASIEITAENVVIGEDDISGDPITLDSVISNVMLSTDEIDASRIITDETTDPETGDTFPVYLNDTLSSIDSALSGKQDALVFNTAYDASTNKVATMADVDDAITYIELPAGVITTGITEQMEPIYLNQTLNEMQNAINGKQDALVFNTAYNASSNKVATMADIPSGGGSSYTAGRQIKIANDVISWNGSMIPDYGGLGWNYSSKTKAEIIELLKNGEMVYNPSSSISLAASDLVVGGKLEVIGPINNSTGLITRNLLSSNSTITLSSDYYYYFMPNKRTAGLSSYDIGGRLFIANNGDFTMLYTYNINDSTKNKTMLYLDKNKQDKLTAGTGISISNNTISADSQLPATPSNDGTYFLKNVVSSGVATQSWENVVIGGSY